MMQEKDFLKIDYVGRIRNTNQIFDLTVEEIAKKENLHDPKQKYGPITIVLGKNSLMKSLEKVLYKMNVGEEKEVNIDARDAFGERRKELIKTMAMKAFMRNNVRPDPNSVVQIGNKTGRIISVTSGRVLVDFNHPLAGKDVHYWIKIIGKIEDEKEKAEFLLKNIFPDVKLEIKDEEVIISLEKEIDKKIRERLKVPLEKELQEYTSLKKVSFKTTKPTQERNV